MPSPAWEDLDEFLEDDEFACPAVIRLQGVATTVSLSGIFDDPHVGASLGEYERDTEGPQFTCREDLVQAVRRGDTIDITFPGKVETFDIMTGAQHDGTGLAVLELARR